MAQEVIINVKANTKEAEASLQGVNGVMKGTEEATGKVTGAITALVGGIVLKIKTLATTIKGFITTAVAGFKSLRVALISTGIGAVVLAVIALKEAFTRSEEGQNKYAKLMAVIGSVTSNLLDLIADLGIYIEIDSNEIGFIEVQRQEGIFSNLNAPAENFTSLHYYSFSFLCLLCAVF